MPKPQPPWLSHRALSKVSNALQKSQSFLTAMGKCESSGPPRKGSKRRSSSIFGEIARERSLEFLFSADYWLFRFANATIKVCLWSGSKLVSEFLWIDLTGIRVRAKLFRGSPRRAIGAPVG